VGGNCRIYHADAHSLYRRQLNDTGARRGPIMRATAAYNKDWSLTAVSVSAAGATTAEWVFKQKKYCAALFLNHVSIRNLRRCDCAMSTG